MRTISLDQMSSLADVTYEEVVGRITAHIADGYPEVPWGLGEAAYGPWVRELVEAAVALEIKHEENLRRFVEWHATIGVQSSLAERFPWAIDVLRVTTEDEDLRVAAVDLRMQGLDGEGD